MSEWYERLSDEQIAWLKSNRVQYRLLTPAEATHLSEVPLAEAEYYYDSWHPVTNSTRYYNDTVYRLRPGWERPKKRTWVFEDITLDEYGYFRRGPSRVRWVWHDVPALPGFIGIIWEWRGYTWVEDGHAPTLRCEDDGHAPTLRCEDDWERWLTCPSVEPPHPIAVRFRRDVEGE